MKTNSDRRKFLKLSLSAAAGLAAIPESYGASNKFREFKDDFPAASAAPQTASIKFSVIGLNHGHIYGITEALIRGGGQLVAFYGKEKDLTDAFAKRYPQAKLAQSEKEILEDNSIQLIASAAIPIDRAPLGVQVMKHGKDFLVDKPGIITLDQLAEARRVAKRNESASMPSCIVNDLRTGPL